MSPEPYTEGVEFVLDEVIRYARMSWPELKPHLQALAFHEIRDAADRNRFAGRPAIARLEDLTERALQSTGHRRRLDLQRTFRLVRERFGQTFIRADLPNPSEAELAAMFEGWIAEAAQDCRARTHIIPCDLSLDGVDRICVGPVTLHTHKSFSPGFEAELEGYLAGVEPERRAHFREPAATQARDYLSAFSEVAEVEVPDCDGPTSRRVAEDVLQILLDYIHVAAGAAYTARMKAMGPAVRGDRRSTIVRADRQLELGYSVAWAGANIAHEAWRQLADAEAAEGLAPMAAILQARVERRDLPLMADRFVDACAWYGDAAREPSPGAAAVKFVTAMERLLWTGERGHGVTQRVAERLAALTFSPETWNFAEIEADVRDAYDLRSSLLHGRISKADPHVDKRLRLCERHARDLLLSWWDRFGVMFMADVSLAHLKRHLDGFTREARDAVRRHRDG